MNWTWMMNRAVKKAVPPKAGTRSIIFAGPYSPPVTGQTIATDFLFRTCSEAGLNVRRVNIVRGNTRNKILNLIIRTARILCCLVVLAWERLLGASVCYLSVDANRGTYVTVLLASFSRLLGYRVVLHHHAFTSIDQRLLRMTLLARVAGSRGVHVTICDYMSRRLREVYPEVCITATQSNAILLSAVSPPDSSLSPTGRFRIGFLGRLTEEKGALDALEVFARLCELKQPVSLTLAGPVGNPAIEAAIRDTREKFGSDNFFTPGMLMGAGKESFYNSIDLFLFPTRYANETQGIVNIEALSHGVPVVAFGRCCVPFDVGEDGGVVVPVGGDFAGAAVAKAIAFIRDPEHHAESRERALRQFAKLKKRAQNDLENLLTILEPSRGTHSVT